MSRKNVEANRNVEVQNTVITLENILKILGIEINQFNFGKFKDLNESQLNTLSRLKKEL